MSKKIGILLINVGTPSAPTKEAVQTYLNEFLTDPSVIQAPAFVRNILFKKIIIPRRSPQSAKKYQKIWTDKGSPLLSFSLDFSNDLQEVMGPQYIVRVAMRYGEPSLQSVIQELKSQGVEKFWMAPVFPQFAEATTGSVIKKIKELLPEDNFQILNEFYKSDSFIKSCAQILESSRSRWDHLLFSYHGLPVGQLKKIPGCYSTQNC
ncbi:MAG: ferrochelatase, partial [Bdellovibrionales bacterium]